MRYPCLALALTVTMTSLFAQSPALAASPRPAWVVQEVYQYNHPFASQLPGELAIIMAKMAASPFGFYRGTAHIFYKDMAVLPVSSFVPQGASAVWLTGDMHIQNTGAIRDSNGNHVFDVLDFDESYLGPYVWDVRRMAVSLFLSAKEVGFGSSDREDITRAFLDAYIDRLADFKGGDEELGYQLEEGNTSGVVKDIIQESRDRTRAELLDKYTLVEGGARRFRPMPELAPITLAVAAGISLAMPDYIASIPASKQLPSSYYVVKDIRLKLGSGTGSLGRYRYYLLIEGPSASLLDDRILEMKQETPSAVSIAAPGLLPPAAYGAHEGRRAALGTKAMLTNTDVLVGFTTVSGAHYFIREKSPHKVDFDYLLLTSKSKFTEAAGYMGKVLAKCHAIADKDYNASLVPVSVDKEITDAVSGNKSGFKAEIVAFAADYADQVKLDYDAFVAAHASGAPLY